MQAVPGPSWPSPTRGPGSQELGGGLPPTPVGGPGPLVFSTRSRGVLSCGDHGIKHPYGARQVQHPMNRRLIWGSARPGAGSRLHRLGSQKAEAHRVPHHPTPAHVPFRTLADCSQPELSTLLYTAAANVGASPTRRVQQDVHSPRGRLSRRGVDPVLQRLRGRLWNCHGRWGASTPTVSLPDPGRPTQLRSLLRAAFISSAEAGLPNW